MKRNTIASSVVAAALSTLGAMRLAAAVAPASAPVGVSQRALSGAMTSFEIEVSLKPDLTLKEILEAHKKEPEKAPIDPNKVVVIAQYIEKVDVAQLVDAVSLIKDPLKRSKTATFVLGQIEALSKKYKEIPQTYSIKDPKFRANLRSDMIEELEILSADGQQALRVFSSEQTSTNGQYFVQFGAASQITNAPLGLAAVPTFLVTTNQVNLTSLEQLGDAQQMLIDLNSDEMGTLVRSLRAQLELTESVNGELTPLRALESTNVMTLAALTAQHAKFDAVIKSFKQRMWELQVAAQAALATNESATARFDPVFVPRGENLELTLPNVQMPTNPVVVSNYSGLTNQPLELIQVSKMAPATVKKIEAFLQILQQHSTQLASYRDQTNITTGSLDDISISIPGSPAK